MNSVSLIGVVDDDEPFRDSLSMLLESAGYQCALFSSAEAFLTSGSLDQTDCIVLDVRMPGMSCPGLQSRIRMRRAFRAIDRPTRSGTRTLDASHDKNYRGHRAVSRRGTSSAARIQ